MFEEEVEVQTTTENQTENQGGEIKGSKLVRSARQPRQKSFGSLSKDPDEEGYSEEEFTKMLDLYTETMRTIEEGEIVTGTILQITENDVLVDIGFKSEGMIPLVEFPDPENLQVGDEIEVYLEDIEDQEGQIVLSKQKADFMKVWDRIRVACENAEVIEGRLIQRVKGGITVDLFGVEAFLPGSQIDIKQVKNFDQFVGQLFPMKIIKINKSRRNIVVSRRAVLEEERESQRRKILEELEVGQIREGIVKNITDFGVFIDLGGVDGLLHITDMSWGRVNHPSEMVSIGDRIKVKILSYDEEKNRVSLGLKQTTPYPWDTVEEKYPEGAKVKGKVVSITDYGAFVELEEGIEGLVHVSEMSWTQHIRHPSKIMSVGDEIECVVLKVDRQNEKISLGLKQMEPNPWLTLDERYPIGTIITGKVRNITNFGAFVEVEEGIDGLIHISDMSWTKRVNHPSEIMKKGDIVSAVIGSIDKENKRISLGYKQLKQDPWESVNVRYGVGTETAGKVSKILDKGIVVELEDGIEGFVPASQLAQPGLKKIAEAFQIGEELPMKVLESDQKRRKIILSVREYFKDKERSELEEYQKRHIPKPITVGEVAEGLATQIPPSEVSTEQVPVTEEPTKPSPEAETTTAEESVKTEPEAEEAVKTEEETKVEEAPEPVADTTAPSVEMEAVIEPPAVAEESVETEPEAEEAAETEEETKAEETSKSKPRRKTSASKRTADSDSSTENL